MEGNTVSKKVKHLTRHWFKSLEVQVAREKRIKQKKEHPCPGVNNSIPSEGLSVSPIVGGVICHVDDYMMDIFEEKQDIEPIDHDNRLVRFWYKNKRDEGRYT